MNNTITVEQQPTENNVLVLPKKIKKNNKKKNSEKHVDESFNRHKDEQICQHCKHHSNKPGYCWAHKQYVARKSTCEDWKKETK